MHAIDIANSIFKPAYTESLKKLPGYHAAYGEVISEGKLIDEAVALIFRSPKSYTGEDMVELSCHGNPQIAARLVAACIAAGAQPAAAGEFTRRAFENGKLDLSQAEAIAELIQAEGDLAATAAQQRRTGELGRKVETLCDALSYVAAQLAVWSDYPEEDDAPVVTRMDLIENLTELRRQLHTLSSGYQTGRLIQKGIQVAIVGRPNVGKSTLLNALCGTERAIVTDIAGTTRDIIEVSTQIDGIALRLLDTAGIRETDDAIERIGVSRAMSAIEESDLILFLIDSSAPITQADLTLLERVKKHPHLVIFNKNDIENASFQHTTPCDVKISATTGEGIETLKNAIKNALGITLTQDGCLVASQRQFDCVIRAQEALDNAIFQLNTGITLEVIGILVEEAISPLAELTGRSVTQAVVEQVFSKFCVGK